jgi:molybdate transport repressor ModE-like protein
MSAALDVTRLRLLREVAVRGSIAAAAREVGLTASAVSQQLAALEREAGIALLDRSARGVHLTGAGHALSERARAIAEVLEEARGDLDRLRGELAGPVRLATVASAAASLVNGAALRLALDHPEITLTVSVTEPDVSIAGIVNGDFDLAVIDRYDGVPLAVPEYLSATELIVEPLVLVTSAADDCGASADASHTSALPVSLRALAGRDWVMPPESAACGRAVRFACRAAGFEPRVRWETDDMLLLMRAVAAGHGVTVLPRLAVTDSVADVVVRSLELPLMTRHLIALTRSSSSERPVVSAVLAALVAAVG